MATRYAKSGTLGAGTVTQLAIYAWSGGIWVQNRDASADIWVRVDSVDPTAEGDDCFLVTAGSARNLATVNGVADVRLISTGTPKYSVSGSVPASVARP